MRDAVLRGMIVGGHGLELIGSVLALPHVVLLALVHGLGLSNPPSLRERINSHPRAWTAEQYRLLSLLWLSDKPARLIAEQLSRSISSVYRKRKFLNLPKRRRLSRKTPAATHPGAVPITLPTPPAGGLSPSLSVSAAVSTVPSRAARTISRTANNTAALPHDVALRTPLENRIGSAWIVRNSPTDLVLYTHRSRAQTSWKTNIEAQYELGLRHLCGQRPERAAADLAVTDKSLASVWSKIGLGRRLEIAYVDDFDLELAELNMLKFEYEFIPDPNMEGWRQWRKRRGGQRLSRLFRKSIRYRNAQCGL